eukprot:768810-Hanusia_phi.AAC.13
MEEQTISYILLHSLASADCHTSFANDLIFTSTILDAKKTGSSSHRGRSNPIDILDMDDGIFEARLEAKHISQHTHGISACGEESDRSKMYTRAP